MFPGGEDLSMVKILGTGLSGLVGSRITELLQDKYDFENLSLETGFDITDKKSINGRIENSGSSKLVLHMAAKADVDSCEKDKSFGEKGDAWRINVLGTQNLVDACKKSKKKIIYISTDFVFDGEKPQDESYNEEDLPNPINWYGQTKYEGERVIKESGLPFIIARIAYPYRSNFPGKLDFVRAMIAKLKGGETINGITNHIMSPTFIDDIAKALDRLINIILKQDITGVYHVVGSQFVSPYEAALSISRIFGFPPSLIAKTTKEDYFRGGAPRPFNLSLKNDKIQKLGLKMSTFKEGLKKIGRQLATSN